jgi:hypothetical protein
VQLVRVLLNKLNRLGFRHHLRKERGNAHPKCQPAIELFIREQSPIHSKSYRGKTLTRDNRKSRIAVNLDIAPGAKLIEGRKS